MDENPTLQEMLADTIANFCAKSGLGIPTGYVYCVSRINEEGKHVLTLGSMEGQQTTFSMGLTKYLSKSFEMDAEDELTAWYAAHSADEEDD